MWSPPVILCCIIDYLNKPFVKGKNSEVMNLAQAYELFRIT